MKNRISLDRAGRVALPKALRHEMCLKPGDQLLIEGEQITLCPVRGQATLKKELGIWVYQGESANESVLDLVEHGREKRIRSVVSLKGNHGKREGRA
jgi:AbrB family looped-hinge helix DNA binding protein